MSMGKLFAKGPSSSDAGSLQRLLLTLLRKELQDEWSPVPVESASLPAFGREWNP